MEYVCVRLIWSWNTACLTCYIIVVTAVPNTNIRHRKIKTVLHTTTITNCSRKPENIQKQLHRLMAVENRCSARAGNYHVRPTNLRKYKTSTAHYGRGNPCPARAGSYHVQTIENTKHLQRYKSSFNPTKVNL